MSKKNSKKDVQPALVGNALSQLGEIVLGGLDVDAGVEAIVPVVVMADFEIMRGYELQVARMKAAAEHVVTEFHATRLQIIAEYESDLGEKGRILLLRQGLVTRAMEAGTQTASYLATVELWKSLCKDVTELPKLLRAHYDAQAGEKYAEELSAVQARLDDRKPAYEAALACGLTAIPEEAGKLLDEAAELAVEIEEIRAILKSALENGN